MIVAMMRTLLTTLSWLTLRVWLLAMIGPTVQAPRAGLRPEYSP